MVWLPWWSGAAEGGNLFYRLDELGNLTPYTPNDFTVVSAADLALTLCQVDTPQKAQAGANSKTKSTDDQSTRVPAATLMQYALARAKGARNDAGFWLACQLRDNGYTKGESQPVLDDYRLRVQDTGTHEYTEAEALSSLDQAFSRPPREPWQIKATEEETAEGTPDSLVYQEGDFTLTVTKQRTKWQVVVARGNVVLGVGVANLADAKARRDLIRNLKDVTPEEAEALAKVLLRLAVCVERDWAEHEGQVAERQQRRRQKQSERAAAEADEKHRERLREVESAAGPVLANSALLHRVGEALQGRGLVGERGNALVLYLCVVSQVTEEPISAVVKGDSSGGKSHLVKVVLAVGPDQAHIDLTSMSEKALIYDDRDYAHRTVVLYEVHGEGGEFSNYLIRTLSSEGQIRHLTVESTPSGPVGREIVKHGPTNFITTTTLPELHAENETRIWTILVDDSPSITRRVLAVQADRARGVFHPGDVKDLHAAFAWLHAAGAKEAVVPFADLLAREMPDKPLRLRRDFPRLLQLIKACALLHQRQRQLDDQGRVIADLADYAMARELVAPIFMRAIAGVTEKTMELVEALKRVLDEKAPNDIEREKARASYSDLVEATGKPKHHVSRWLRPALEIGLVDNENAGEKGRPAALKMGKFSVEEGGDVLPAVAEVARKLNVNVRWVSPSTGQETVLQCCKTDCNGIVFAQGIENEPVTANQGASVAVLQGGEGGVCARAAQVPSGLGAGGEFIPPSSPCNTATLAPPASASPSYTGPSDNCIPLQCELQHSATPSPPGEEVGDGWMGGEL